MLSYKEYTTTAEALSPKLHNVEADLTSKQREIYRTIVRATKTQGHYNASQELKRWPSIAPKINSINALVKTGLVEPIGRNDPQRRLYIAKY